MRKTKAIRHSMDTAATQGGNSKGWMIRQTLWRRRRGVSESYYGFGSSLGSSLKKQSLVASYNLCVM